MLSEKSVHLKKPITARSKTCDDNGVLSKNAYN